MLLLLGSAVVRCILVTVEKKGRGNSDRLHELIAAQEMYRSNRGLSVNCLSSGRGHEIIIGHQRRCCSDHSANFFRFASQATAPVKAKTIA